MDFDPNHDVSFAMKPSMRVANNLRRLRAERSLSQEELAHRAGISVRYLGSIERGRGNVSILTLEKLATALAIEPALLLAH